MGDVVKQEARQRAVRELRRIHVLEAKMKDSITHFLEGMTVADRLRSLVLLRESANRLRHEAIAKEVEEASPLLRRAWLELDPTRIKPKELVVASRRVTLPRHPARDPVTKSKQAIVATTEIIRRWPSTSEIVAQVASRSGLAKWLIDRPACKMTPEKVLGLVRTSRGRVNTAACKLVASYAGAHWKQIEVIHRWMAYRFRRQER